MPHVIHTYTNIGLEGHHISIEVDANKALPTIDIIGLPDAAIKESKERIRATFRNTGVQLPARKIVLNLAPSHIRKVGTRFDVPLAAAILRLIEDPQGPIGAFFDTTLFFGELGLDGTVKRVDGILPSVISAFQQGWTSFVVPDSNANEVAYVPGIKVYSLTNFLQLVEMCAGSKSIEDLRVENISIKDLGSPRISVDFADIKGHVVPKRALTIAASGMHNVLMSGPPGSGKSMLAKALQGILPPLHFEEVIEVSQIYSVVGQLNKDTPLVTQRPRRSVHHTASPVSIVGGGRFLRPGEISLAHHGILFFDELPEFPREVLEVLRQPIEDKVITISRASGSVQYPSDFMFVAAMNPCKCGFFQDKQKACSCSLQEVKRYQSKISGPMLDRFDLVLEIPRENIDVIMDKESHQSSTEIQEQVVQAWDRQQKRYDGTYVHNNSQLDSKLISKYISLQPEAETFLKDVVKRLNLSARVAHRAIKVARTIADIQGVDVVSRSHIAEAFQYREKTMFVDS